MAAVNGIAADKVENFGVFFGGGAECAAASGNIVEEIFYLQGVRIMMVSSDRNTSYCDLCALSAGTWLGICTLARFRGDKLATSILSSPSTA